MHQTVGEGVTLTCTACGKTWIEGENGVLTATSGETEFSHVPDWFEWQKQVIREKVFNKEYYFETEADVMTLPDGIKYVPQGRGKIVQTYDKTTIFVNLYGEDKVFEYSGTELESVHIEFNYKGEGDFIDFSIPDDSVWLRPDKKDVITMMSIATEEIRDFCKQNIKK
jgi:hypothetical protein